MLFTAAIVVVGVAAAVPTALFLQTNREPRAAVTSEPEPRVSSMVPAEPVPVPPAPSVASVASSEREDAGPPKAIVDAGAKSVASAKAPSADAEGPGFLTINTVPPARVSERGRVLCTTTPCAKLPLSPGAHTITLENKEDSIKTVIVVAITSGETTSRRVTLKQ